MAGLRKWPPAIDEDWANDIVDYLGGPTTEPQITTLKILEDGSTNHLLQNKGRNVSLNIGANTINLVAVEPDTNYIVLITVVGVAATVRVTAKTTTSFTVEASVATSIDWVLVR